MHYSIIEIYSGNKTAAITPFVVLFYSKCGCRSQITNLSTSSPWWVPPQRHLQVDSDRVDSVLEDSVRVDSVQVGNVQGDNGQEDNVRVGTNQEDTGCAHWESESPEVRDDDAADNALVDIAVDYTMDPGSSGRSGSDGHRSLQYPGRSDKGTVDAPPTFSINLHEERATLKLELRKQHKRQ